MKSAVCLAVCMIVALVISGLLLPEAIDKRIEAVKIMLELEDYQGVEKVEDIIVESNGHLSKAASLFEAKN